MAASPKSRISRRLLQGLSKKKRGAHSAQSSKFPERAAAVLGAAIGVQQSARAAFVSASMNLRGTIQYIKFDQPTRAPMAMVCLTCGNECKPPRMVFRGGRLKLTPERVAQLQDVNQQVNAALQPEPNLEGLRDEKWLLHPTSGDCNDYAVTKRHDLIAKGRPARSALLEQGGPRALLEDEGEDDASSDQGGSCER